jgi:tetratricopeptide (TPR) repeat protein
MNLAAHWFDRALVDGDGSASATAWFNLGVTLFAADRLGEARRALAQAVQRDANLAEAYYFLAVIAERAGNRSEAVSQVRIALRLDGDHAQAQRLLAKFNDFDH